MSTQEIQAGEAFIQLNIKGDEFQKSLNKLGNSIENFGSQTKSILSSLKGLFKNSIADCGQLSQAISLTGTSITGIGFTFGVFEKFRQHLQEISILNIENKFSELQKIAALRLSFKIQSENVIVQKAIAASSYLCAIGIKVLAAAQWVLNAAFLGCPLTWFVAGIAAVGAAVGTAMYFFGAFNDKLADHAKAMEEARKKNESYLTSARSSLETLQEFSNIDPWQSDKKSVNLSAWKELQRTTEELGISLESLGVKFDANTGKIDASEQAIAKLKEAMRVKELNDLNAAIEAQEEHLDDLHSKLDKNGKVGWGRWIGTYVTLGYMDNAEEIQKKIDETSQSLQENQEKRKVVVDFSAEYKENEAKLQEMYDKEAEASQNALAVKIDNIKTEFSEREAILKQLIDEAEVRDSLSFEDMEKLRERRAALAGLNAEQEERIQLLREEQSEKYPLQDVTAWLGNSPAAPPASAFSLFQKL